MILGACIVAEQQRRATVILSTFANLIYSAIDKSKDLTREPLSDDVEAAAKFPKN
jgi:hypothetical protein